MRKKLHASWCFYAGIWGVILGVVFSQIFEYIVIKSWLWLVVAGIMFCFTLHFARYWMIPFALIAGLILGNFRSFSIISGKAYVSSLIDSIVIISGNISEDPAINNNKAALRLDHLKIHSEASGEQIKVSGMIYVQLSGKIPELERSDRITLTGKLGSNFGTFVGTMYRPEILKVERASSGDIPARIKHWFADNIHEFIASPEADLGLGYLVGMKSGLPENLSTTLQAVGMTHVVVASGAHLGILISAAKKLFGRISRFASTLFSLLLILGFVAIIGPTPSMTRAALVSSFSLIVGYVGRKWTPIRLLSFVAMITLLLDPTYILNLGWQLSFASFFGLLVISPRVQKALYGGKHPSWLASMLITSFSTSIICAPILIYNFGSVSLLSFAANLIILPTLPYAMLLTFLTGISSPIVWLGEIFAKLTTYLLDLHILLVNFLGEKKMFIFELPAGKPEFFLTYIPILFLLCFPVLRRQVQAIAQTKKICYNKVHEG